MYNKGVSRKQQEVKKMGVIAIRLSNEIEKQIKEKAQTEGKSVSAYCKEVILEGHQEQELSRVTIENEIDELRKSLDRINKNMLALSKRILQDTQMSSNLVQGFFNAVIEDDQTKLTIYQAAEQETQEYMAKLFGR